MRILFNLLLIFVIISIQCAHVRSQTEVGDACNNSVTGEVGTCKLTSDCPEALENLMVTSQAPTVCSYQNLIDIVCCPNKNPTQPPTLSKRALKCIEYGEAVYQKKWPNGTVLENRIDKCAVTEMPTSLGATATRPREFPHSALLGYQTKDSTVSWSCGGALISDNFVVTAANCMKSQEHGDVKYVRLGDMAGTDYCNDARPETYMIAQMIPHPKYSPTSHYNDIALLKLEGQVTFGPYIRPICLPTEKLIRSALPIASLSDNIVVTTGWGTFDTTITSTNSLYFSKIALDLFTFGECYTNYQSHINSQLHFGIVDEMQICAGTRVPFWRPCYGDSGAPLEKLHPSVYCTHELIGVTSFGKACGTLYILEVYTRVSYYADWIEGIVWPG